MADFQDDFTLLALASTTHALFFNCLALSRNFGQPETGPTCHFCFRFLVIRRRTFQLKHKGGGVCFWTTGSQDNLVGLHTTDYPLRPGSYQ